MQWDHGERCSSRRGVYVYQSLAKAIKHALAQRKAHTAAWNHVRRNLARKTQASKQRAA